jgi:hypothetical protein
MPITSQPLAARTRAQIEVLSCCRQPTIRGFWTSARTVLILLTRVVQKKFLLRRGWLPRQPSPLAVGTGLALK